MIFHRLCTQMKDHTHTLSVGERDICSSIEGALRPLSNVQYCTQSVCVNTILINLHSKLLHGDTRCMYEINRYVSTCSFLQQCDTNETINTICRDSLKLTLKCICGDSSHDLCICKRNYVHELPIPICPVMKKNLQQPRSVVLDLQSFIPSVDMSLCYENLPDICSCIQYVLQKRFLDRHVKPRISKSEKKSIVKAGMRCNHRGL